MALSSWSSMRKYLEKEMLAPSLQGRVRYNCTHYEGMDGWGIFEIFIDDEMVKRFSLVSVNSYFIKNGYKENDNPYGIEEYWKDFWKTFDEVPFASRTEYTDIEFSEALERYRNQAIKDSITSDNPIERMFAVLDRRIGKRSLLSLKPEIANQPKWLQRFYNLRMEAEKI